MTTIDFDKPQLCPICNGHMQVMMPILITPGEDVDTGKIDYESGFAKHAGNWWCETCQSHHFPVGLDVEFSAVAEELKAEAARLANTYCSQCGGEFGPGEHGYSHCEDHKH